MKNSLLFLILFIVYSNSYGQKDIIENQFKYKITYNLRYQMDSTDIESQKGEKMVLYIGDEFSRFSSEGKAIGDSIRSNMSESDYNVSTYMSMRNQIPKVAFEYYLYKGIPEGKITYTREFIDDKYRYTENQGRFDWTVHDERDTIAGFSVQKATTRFSGRDYTAWFTEEIPFSEGPYKFNGLPGLIIKIKDNKGHYVYELIGIQKLKNPIPLAFQKDEYMETTKKELSDLELEFKRDPAGFINRSMPDVNIKVNYKSKAHKIKLEGQRREKLRNQNNPIELE